MRQLEGVERKVWEDSTERRCVSLTSDGWMLSKLGSTKSVHSPLVSIASWKKGMLLTSLYLHTASWLEYNEFSSHSIMNSFKS